MSVEPKGRKIDGESPRSCFIRPPKRRATSVIAAQTSNINPKQLHDRNSAVAQAQQDGCTGNFRIFDSPFGNFLVPVIPTPAELAGSDNPSMLLSKVWNLGDLEDNRVEQGYVIEPESPLLEGLAKMLAVSMANPNLFFLRHCPQENKACSSTVFIQERRMIDRFRIWAKGGDGGNGCNSIRRSRHDRRGRPDGGNGGRGGDVILECSPTMWDLSALQHHINAKRGGNGSSKNMIGSRGADKVIQVPVGTVIHLVEGELPSAVEKSSSSKLDPWEIPGTVDTDSSEFSTQSISVDQTSSKVEKKVKSSGRRASRGEEYSTPRTQIFGLPTNSRTTCSIASDKFESDDDDLSDWEEESCGQMEDQDGDDIMGTECEDELEETELIEYNVAELTEQGQRIVVARGGEGGLGNLSMRKASKMMQKGANSDDEVSDDYDHASPSVGLPGSEVVLVLELKSIADVGLIGMPNAGKSTLLGALSKAKPVVGDYAFTTLRPNLGNVNYYDFSLTVADIPGLIRGAHENRGLGHAFLRHIERTKVLAYVVDLAAALGDNKGIPPWEQLNDLILELEYYSEGLSDRPSLVVANKVDEDGAEEVYKELKRRVSGVPVFPVSAILEEGVPELKDGLRMLISGEQTHRLKLDGIVLHQNAASVSI